MKTVRSLLLRTDGALFLRYSGGVGVNARVPKGDFVECVQAGMSAETSFASSQLNTFSHSRPGRLCEPRPGERLLLGAWNYPEEPAPWHWHNRITGAAEQ